MNDPKTEPKKAPSKGGKRKTYPPRQWPRYPESFTHARGLRSSWRSSERNA